MLKETNMLHVIPMSARKWAVKFASTRRPVSMHRTLREAVAHAKELAVSQEQDLVFIHKRNGTIQQAHAHHVPKTATKKDFEKDLDYVLTKNAKLYKRLAK